MIIVSVMRGARDLFIWGARLLTREIVTFIRNCSGHVYSEKTSIISRGKALYLELRPTMLELAMAFVASNGDCFCSVRYLGCESMFTDRSTRAVGAVLLPAFRALPGWPLVE